jgi:hypothetical protein
MKVMGETGAGITSEDQINMDQDNEFTNKWSTYLNCCHHLAIPHGWIRNYQGEISMVLGSEGAHLRTS